MMMDLLPPWTIMKAPQKARCSLKNYQKSSASFGDNFAKECQSRSKLGTPKQGESSGPPRCGVCRLTYHATKDCFKRQIGSNQSRMCSDVIYANKRDPVEKIVGIRARTSKKLKLQGKYTVIYKEYASKKRIIRLKGIQRLEVQ